MQTYDVGTMTLVVDGKDMLPVGDVCDTHTDLLMQFGEAQVRYNRRFNTISGTGVRLEYSPHNAPDIAAVVHLDEPGKSVSDMKVLAVLRTGSRVLH